MGKEENEMRPLKKAQQQNLIISKEYYTEHELMKMLENKEIWYLDDDINFRCDRSLLGFNDSAVEGFWDGRTYTKDLKSIVSNLGIDAFPLIPVGAKPSKAGD